MVASTIDPDCHSLVMRYLGAKNVELRLNAMCLQTDSLLGGTAYLRGSV
jgi:hypothetical protein